MHSATNVIFRADATLLRTQLGACIVGPRPHPRRSARVSSIAGALSVSLRAAPTRKEARAPHAGASWTSGPQLNPTKDRMAFDIAYDGVLIRTRLYDVLSGTDLMKMADAILGIEAATARTPPRLTDLREVTRLDVGYAEVSTIAERRRESVVATPIKSAILVDTQWQFGTARMFQQLGAHPQVTLEIFRDLDEALAWLATPP